MVYIGARDREIRAAQAANEILDPYSTPLGQEFKPPTDEDFARLAAEKGIDASDVQAAYQRATRKPKAYNVGKGSEVQKARSRAKSSISEIRPGVFKIKTQSGTRVVKGKENLSNVRLDTGAGIVGFDTSLNVIPSKILDEKARKQAAKDRAQAAYRDVKRFEAQYEAARQRKDLIENLVGRVNDQRMDMIPGPVTGYVSAADNLPKKPNSPLQRLKDTINVPLQRTRLNLDVYGSQAKSGGDYLSPILLSSVGGVSNVAQSTVQSPVKTAAFYGGLLLVGAVSAPAAALVGVGITGKYLYDRGRSGRLFSPEGFGETIGELGGYALLGKGTSKAAPKVAKLARTVEAKAYQFDFNVKNRGQLITSSMFERLPQLQSRGLSVNVLGRPFENVFAARATKTGKINLRESALEVSQGKPARVNPADAPELISIVGKRTRVTQDNNLRINSAKDPALALNTPTRPSKSIVTEDVALIGKASSFNKLFGTERAEASSVGSGFGIFQSRFYPDSVRVLGTQAAKGSGQKFNVLEIFQGKVKGYRRDSSNGSRAKGQSGRAKPRLDFSFPELTGVSKPRLSGKQVQSFENSFGVGKQLYVFDRADIKVRQFGTSKNPVAETFQYFPKPTSTGGFSNEATYNVFGEKVTIKKKGSVDVFKNDDLEIEKEQKKIREEVFEGIYAKQQRQTAISILEPLTKSTSKSKQKKKKGKEKTKARTESQFKFKSSSPETDAVYGFRTPRQAQQARSRSSTRSGQRSFQSFFPILGQRSGQKSFQSPAYKPASLQVPGLTVSPSSVQRPKITQTPDQKITPDSSFDFIFDFDTPPPSPPDRPTTRTPPPDIPGGGLKPPASERENKKQKGNAFNVFVKENQYSLFFRKINKKPLSRRDALGFGASVVDHTISQTFKIAPAKGKPKPSNYGRVWQQKKSKFRQQKVRGQYRQFNPYVEKRAFAIDTPGEKNDLTVAQFLRGSRGKRNKSTNKKRKYVFSGLI